MNVMVVGCGAMGKKHVSVLKQISDTKVFMVDPASSDLEVFSSIDAVLSKNKIDFAVIATPTKTHYDIACQLLQSKISVLIEKPVFHDLVDKEQLLNLASKNNCKLAVGHIERFNPAVVALKNELANQKVLHAKFERLSPFPNRVMDVGVKLDLAIHDVDLINFILPSKIKSCASGKTRAFADNEDTAAFLFNLEDGSTASVLTSWLSPFRRRGIEVLTDKNFYEVDLINQTAIRRTAHTCNSHTSHNVFINKHNALKVQLESFMSYVKNNEIGNLATIEDGYEALGYVL